MFPVKVLLLSFVGLLLPVAAQTPRIAIIKADDVTSAHPKWDRFFHIAEKHGVPVSAGIITNSFDKQDEKYDEWLKKWDATGRVEFWNHGWDHRRWEEGGQKKSEFLGSGEEHQRDHLAKAQQAGEAALGKPFIAFGSPFNDMDAATARTLNEVPALKLIFCRPDAEPAKALQGKILLPMHLRGEVEGTGKADFAKFREQYEKRRNDPALAICAFQFHPMAFSDQAFTDFEAILVFLKEEGWTFMLPRQYAEKVGGKE